MALSNHVNGFCCKSHNRFFWNEYSIPTNLLLLRSDFDANIAKIGTITYRLTSQTRGHYIAFTSLQHNLIILHIFAVHLDLLVSSVNSFSNCMELRVALQSRFNVRQWYSLLFIGIAICWLLQSTGGAALHHFLVCMSLGSHVTQRLLLS